MKRELELKLQEDFPQFFVDLYGDPTKTCMSEAHGGIAICDGWHDLFRTLCEDLSKVVDSDFKFLQVKEKFGYLRIYASGGNEESNKLIDAAEAKSGEICEGCGATEGVTLEGRWIRALCASCRNPS